MTLRTARFAAIVAALLAGAACGDGTGPKAGNVNISLTGTMPARSAQFRVVGPQTDVSAGGANVRVVFSPLGGDTIMVAVVANVGHTLSESNIATLSVPDVGAATSYAITLLQVAAPNYALQNLATYSLTIH